MKLYRIGTEYGDKHLVLAENEADALAMLVEELFYDQDDIAGLQVIEYPLDQSYLLPTPHNPDLTFDKEE